MYFTTQDFIITALLFAPSTLSAPSPKPSLCKGPDGKGLTDCLTPDSQQCSGVWDSKGGDITGVQHWSIGANNVNEWDQTKFSRQLTNRACAPTNVKSSYDPNTLIVATKWTTSSTCTAGRVTAAFANSAGLRRVDCTLEEHPKVDAGSIKSLLTGAVEVALKALTSFGGKTG